MSNVAGMLPLIPNLQIRLAWSDSDMLELRLCASSENFSGCVNFYAGFNALPDLAALLNGFPTSTTDVRTVELGSDDVPGYGGARIRFCCRDSLGHLVAEVAMFAAPEGPNDVAQSAVVQVATVPSDIDSFIDQLRGIGTQIGSAATLKNAS